jgi:hypothetical protein
MAGAHDDDVGLDDRAREGLDHLQAAAKEMIQAARTMLDVVEELVDDPAMVQDVVGTLGSFAAAAAARVRPRAERPGDDDRDDDGDDDVDAGRDRRIRLS